MAREGAVYVSSVILFINQSKKEIIMTKVILNDCREITTQEYCDITDKRDLKFEGQTRANKEGVYWIVWNDNGELLKIKCSLNY